MAKVRVYYQTTLFYEEDIEVPDQFVSEGVELTEEGMDYANERLSYRDEIDADTEITYFDLLKD